MKNQKGIFQFLSGTYLLVLMLLATPLWAWQAPPYGNPYLYNNTAYPAMPHVQNRPYAQPINYRGYPPPAYPSMRPSMPMYPPLPQYAPQNTLNKATKQTRINKQESFKKQSNVANEVKQRPNQSRMVKANKAEFINRLLPHIHQENSRLIDLRKRFEHSLKDLKANQSANSDIAAWIKKLAKKYRVKGNPVTNPEVAKELMLKIDIIPPSLALAQAANESAWGQSRFATQANNLFGIWTFDENKGLKPLQREQGQKHLVRKFEHIGESVSYYMHTLNSHPSYQELREMRKQFRDKQQALEGHELAKGLLKYSAMGSQYIETIQSMIRQNKWAKLDMEKKPT